MIGDRSHKDCDCDGWGSDLYAEVGRIFKGCEDDGESLLVLRLFEELCGCLNGCGYKCAARTFIQLCIDVGMSSLGSHAFRLWETVLESVFAKFSGYSG